MTEFGSGPRRRPPVDDDIAASPPIGAEQPTTRHATPGKKEKGETQRERGDVKPPLSWASR
jgi:hypothetical protein